MPTPGRANTPESDDWDVSKLQLDWEKRGVAHPPEQQRETLSDSIPAEVAPPRPVSPRRYPVRMTLLGLLALALAGTAVWWRPWRPSPSFVLVLDELRALSLKAGEVTTVTVDVRRINGAEPIRLTFPDSSHGIKIADATIPADRQSAAVHVTALPDASPGQRSVPVLALAEKEQREASFELSIGPLGYYLPQNWHKVDGAPVREVGGTVYYERIEVVRGDLPVRFVLISQGEGEERAPFPNETCYVMEDKVWVGLFRKFVSSARQSGHPLHNNDWRTMKFAGIPVNWSDDNPVMGVTAPDAHRCALWLGGKLPLPHQLDRAGGRYDRGRGDGPYRPGYRFCLVREKLGSAIAAPPWCALQSLPILMYTGTMRRGAAVNSVSPRGVRDLGGNGLEWTGKTESVGEAERTGRDKDFSRLTGNDFVILRGRRFSAARPLRFKDLDDGPPPVGIGVDPDPEIGFRVAIEPQDR
jgi:hypothetical protein